VFHSFEHRYDLDQNANVDIFRRWNQVVAPYGALLLGETGPEDPVRMARYHDGGAAIHRTFYLGPGWHGWEPMRLRDGIRGMHLASPDSIAWMIDSHDTSHSVTRYGTGDVGATRSMCVTTLMMALGGMPFLYQGQELGIDDGEIDPGDLADPISTRNPGAQGGRDGARTAMPWDGGPGNGFTTAGKAWLPSAPRAVEATVAGQRDDPGSALARHRRLLAVRRANPDLWTAPVEWIDTVDPLVMALRRNSVVVAANLDEYPATVPLPDGSWRPVFWSRDGGEGLPVTGSLGLPAETTVILVVEPD
jgi:alpha-glucosidase